MHGGGSWCGPISVNGAPAATLGQGRPIVPHNPCCRGEARGLGGCLLAPPRVARDQLRVDLKAEVFRFIQKLNDADRC